MGKPLQLVHIFYYISCFRIIWFVCQWIYLCNQVADEICWDRQRPLPSQTPPATHTSHTYTYAHISSFPYGPSLTYSILAYEIEGNRNNQGIQTEAFYIDCMHHKSLLVQIFSLSVWEESALSVDFASRGLIKQYVIKKYRDNF